MFVFIITLIMLEYLVKLQTTSGTLESRDGASLPRSATTPRQKKIGHRRVDKLGETTYKKVSFTPTFSSVKVQGPPKYANAIQTFFPMPLPWCHDNILQPNYLGYLALGLLLWTTFGLFCYLKYVWWLRCGQKNHCLSWSWINLRQALNWVSDIKYKPVSSRCWKDSDEDYHRSRRMLSTNYCVTMAPDTQFGQNPSFTSTWGLRFSRCWTY